MITLFECTEKTCPNFGVVYRMEDVAKITICGGCKRTLTGTLESEE